jgi:glycosyltransferase involved in cell wall biosynthesis
MKSITLDNKQMQNKKTILIHSNFCKAFTGFGKNKKNILRYLYSTGKYNIIEAANGHQLDDPYLKSVPWKCYGTLPPMQKLQSMNADQQRATSYGGDMIDEIINLSKPDVYIGIEDIWAFNDFHKKSWWNKINCMVWTTLDSLPILQQAIDYAPKIKNYYVWASFAEKAFNKMGYDHIKTLRGSLDVKNFFRLRDEDRSQLRQKFNIEQNTFIIGFVFRNQLRKSVPNLLEGFKQFKIKNSESKAKLLLHTHWSEGWNIPDLLKEKNINFEDILTTYFCNKCNSYEIRTFIGQEQKCKYCGTEKSLNTTNIQQGVSEKQLNEIYNLMDVYCHPFTSGGQEIPIQEAKLTELITLVTDYSCGEDNCTIDSGGVPLKWSEYREPGTQFIKASTDSLSIASEIENVYKMDISHRREIEKISRQWAIDNFSIEVIGKKLEDIIDAMPDINYDFSNNPLLMNENYKPVNGLSKDEFIIDLYKNIFNEDIDKNSTGFKHWDNELINNRIDANGLLNHFTQVAKQTNQQNTKIEFASLFSEEDEGKRIAVIIPKSETDVLLINSLMKNLKSQYPEHNIYIFTQEEYFQYIEDNPYIHKCLKYSEILENVVLLEGAGDHKGFFEMAFHPHTTTQKSICYLHNGLNKNQFSLSE